MSGIKLAIIAALVLCAASALDTSAPGARAAQPKIAPPRDLAKEIADLEKQIKDAEVAHHRLMEGLRHAEKRLDIAEAALIRTCGGSSDWRDTKEIVEAFKQRADETAVKLTKLKDQLAKLKAARSRA